MNPPQSTDAVARNLSPQAMFEQMALEHRPTAGFERTIEAGESFAHWKARTWPQVVATLGDWAARPPLNPTLLAQWEDDGLCKQRWIIDVHQYLSATVQVNLPGDLRAGEKRATILCWHGHGDLGKAPVMNTAGSEQHKANVARHNYAYGHAMAQAGFVTFAIDWIGGGERGDANWPHQQGQKAAGRDWCNLYYLHATMLGMTSLSINLAHGRAATDFACSLPQVDAEKLGVMGLSGGGTMALWSALCDERFKATEVICYSDLWPLFGTRDINYCGMQVAPGLFKLVHLHDLQGLLAPRPLLVDIGAYDTVFAVENALACYREVEQIYAAAGASENLNLDLFAGEHAWGANKSVDFFSQFLQAALQ